MPNDVITRAGHGGLNLEAPDLDTMLREEVLPSAQEMFADITGNGKVETLALFPDTSDFTVSLTVDATAPTGLLLVDMDFMRRQITAILAGAGSKNLKAAALLGVFISWRGAHGADVDTTVYVDHSINIFVSEKVQTYSEGAIPEALHFVSVNKYAVLQTGGGDEGSAGVPTHSQRQVVCLNNPVILEATSPDYVEAGGFDVVQKSNLTAFANTAVQTLHAKVTWVLKELSDGKQQFEYNPDAFKRFLTKK